MLLLALDTSTRQASIALCADDVVYGEHIWQVGKNHSVELLAHVQQLFMECHMTMSQLDAVAVATGPGSFNGVRVALATAKALAFALKKPLLGVTTLDISAAQHWYWRGPVCAILEAGRAELYAACYAFEQVAESNGNLTYQMRMLGDFLLLSPQQVAQYVLEQTSAWFAVAGELHVPPTLFCGECSPASQQILQTMMQEQGLFVQGAQAIRRADVLSQLAFRRLRAGQEDDPLLLEPLYLRRPSITSSKRKRSLLGNNAQGPDAGQSQTEREEGALRH